MKRLFLLRHAEAASPNGPDHDRHLTETGKNQARALGKVMAEKNYVPDLVLCSTAIRTRQTLEGISSALNTTNVDYLNEIYSGSAEQLLTLIKPIGDNVANILLVAHNPSIYELSVALTGDSEAHLINKLGAGYAPGTLSVFDYLGESWSDIKPKENTLIDLLSPYEYAVNHSA